MKSTDKFLIGIVAGIVLLIVIALVATLTRPEPVYQAKDTPEGVAHNYLLALQKRDYERAYGYLSPVLMSYPASADEFAEHVLDNSRNFRLDTDTALEIESTTVISSLAMVSVRESYFRAGDLFDSGQHIRVFEMKLQFVDSAWKIADSDYYFARCWRQKRGCN